MNKEFKELFSNLSEKDQKEVANLIRFKNEVKYHDKQFEELLSQYIELSREHDKLQKNWNEFKIYIEDELCSKYIHKYDILEKMQELEGKSE